MSLPEILLWTRLRRRDPEFYAIRRQHPVGPYIVDFYCSDLDLGFEIDGASHSCAGRPDHDERREAYLARQGVRLIRYAAVTVLDDPDEVAWWIKHLVRKPAPLPPWLASPDHLAPEPEP